MLVPGMTLGSLAFMASTYLRSHSTSTRINIFVYIYLIYLCIGEGCFDINTIYFCIFVSKYLTKKGVTWLWLRAQSIMVEKGDGGNSSQSVSLPSPIWQIRKKGRASNLKYLPQWATFSRDASLAKAPWPPQNSTTIWKTFTHTCEAVGLFTLKLQQSRMQTTSYYNTSCYLTTTGLCP